nr:MAG: hypothetical protein [Sclerotinia sclerotiorum barnavirus 1]
MVRNIDALVRSGKITAAEGARRKAQQALDRARGNPQIGVAPRGVKMGGVESIDIDITGEWTMKDGYGGWDLFHPAHYSGPLVLYDNVSLTGVHMVVTTGMKFDEELERVVFGLTQEHDNATNILRVAELKGAVAIRKACLGTRFNLSLRPTDRRLFVRNGHFVSEGEFGKLNLVYVHEGEQMSFQLRVVCTFACSKRKPNGLKWEVRSDTGDNPGLTGAYFSKAKPVASSSMKTFGLGIGAKAASID